MAHRSSRRDFLKGKTALHTVGDLIEQALPDFPQPPPPAPVESYLLHLSRQAMACEFQFLFNAGQYPQATEAALEALDLVETLEEQMSVFRASSELSRLNRGAAEGPLPVEPRLLAILQLAHGSTPRRPGPTTSPRRRSGGPGDSPAARAACRRPSNSPKPGATSADNSSSSIPTPARSASSSRAWN